MVGQTAIEILDFGDRCGGDDGSVCVYVGGRNGSAYFRIEMNNSISLSLSLPQIGNLIKKKKSPISDTIPRESWYTNKLLPFLNTNDSEGPLLR
jgi:hypothetical protein